MNGSLGTDHGQAGLLIIAGGNVNAGVYNCDKDTWPGLLSDASGRYIGMAEDGGDFRDIIVELLTKSGGFGVSNAARDEIFPDYTFNSSDDLGIITDD